MTMFKLMPLIAACVACSPASQPEPVKAQSALGYATQTTAPSPDYAMLLKQPLPAIQQPRRREATLPLPPGAKQVGDKWVERLKQRGALLGYGLAGKSANGPVNMIDTGLTESEFKRWANDNGWQVPAHMAWSFVPEMNFPAISEAAKNAVRVWPASMARTGMQHQALFNGRVELRDGCLFVGQFGQPADKLAWLHAEIGLDRDSDGYFIVRDRVSGQTLARLGEKMSWGGPASADIDAETKRALQDACGSADIYIVGSPESSERFLTQYPHLRGLQSPPPAPPVSRD